MQDDITQEEADAMLKDASGNTDAGEDAAAESQPDETVENANPMSSDASEPMTQRPIGGSEEIAASPGQLDTLRSVVGAPSDTKGNINFLLDVPLDVTVELGRTKIALKDMLQLGPGSVIELDKLIGEPVDLLINERLIAKGEVVVFDESFGVRITDIINPEERIKSLG